MTGLIILAAGESKRLGEPKQNLLFLDKTLLQRSVETACETNCSPVLVVLGANYDLIYPRIPQDKVKILHNPEWREGLASSIRVGIAALAEIDEIDSVVIMLCDQPFVTSALIDELIRKQQLTGKAIVACAYKQTVGVPVIFQRALFNELLLLQGDEGAKKLLKSHPDDIESLPFEGGSIDIDTTEDFNNLIS